MIELLPGAWNLLLSEESANRLDSFLTAKIPALSRSRIQKLIEQGFVKFNGEVAKANLKVQAGDRLEVFLPEPKQSALLPEEIPLHILYEDEHLAVVEKPAGLVVHPAVGHEGGTLVNALLHRFGHELSTSAGIGGEQRPGIVHRIDKNTSGILLITKTDFSHQSLSAQFKEHSITRRYQGMVWGQLPEKGEWNESIGRDPKERKRMACISSGRKALTKFKCLQNFGKVASHFEAELFTGRTHQIRVHFSHHGFPLLGDSTYGGSGASSRMSRVQKKIKEPTLASLVSNLEEKGRQFLHAAHLGFLHPKTGQRMEFNSPLPLDLAEILLTFTQCKSTI